MKPSLITKVVRSKSFMRLWQNTYKYSTTVGQKRFSGALWLGSRKFCKYVVCVDAKILPQKYEYTNSMWWRIFRLRCKQAFYLELHYNTFRIACFWIIYILGSYCLRCETWESDLFNICLFKDNNKFGVYGAWESVIKHNLRFWVKKFVRTNYFWQSIISTQFIFWPALAWDKIKWFRLYWVL